MEPMLSVVTDKQTMPEIVSMVTVAYLGRSLDLEALVKHLGHFVYEPDQFPAAFYSFKQPNITFAIFSSGKVMSYGGKKLEHVRTSFSILVSELGPMNLQKNKIVKPRVCMMVAKADFGRTIDIEELPTRLRNCVYEPDQFPGLIWRLPDKVVVLLFSSGKCVITGAKSHQMLQKAYREVTSQIFSYSEIGER